jgi:hypothetical protein
MKRASLLKEPFWQGDEGVMMMLLELERYGSDKMRKWRDKMKMSMFHKTVIPHRGKLVRLSFSVTAILV